MGAESSSLNKYEIGEIYSDTGGLTIASATSHNFKDKYTIFQYNKKSTSEQSKKNVEVNFLL